MFKYKKIHSYLTLAIHYTCKLKHRQHLNKKNRQGSFLIENYPPDRMENMTTNGFIFSQKTNKIKCFMCGCSLKDDCSQSNETLLINHEDKCLFAIKLKLKLNRLSNEEFDQLKITAESYFEKLKCEYKIFRTESVKALRTCEILGHDKDCINYSVCKILLDGKKNARASDLVKSVSAMVLEQEENTKGYQKILQIIQEEVDIQMTKNTLHDKNGVINENYKLIAMYICKSCVERRACYLCKPCGHLSLCEVCLISNSHCPVCNDRITSSELAIYADSILSQESENNDNTTNMVEDIVDIQQKSEDIANTNNNNNMTRGNGSQYFGGPLTIEHLIRENLRTSKIFLCRVCFTNRADILCLPCRHLSVCWNCFRGREERGLCPIYGKPIEDTIKVRYANHILSSDETSQIIEPIMASDVFKS